MSENHKAIIQEVNMAFTENNLEGFLAHCADNVEWTMVGAMTTKGKDGIRQQMTDMNSEPPKIITNNVIAEGEFATAYGDMTMKEDGKTVSYYFCDIYRFQDDKIVELKTLMVKT